MTVQSHIPSIYPPVTIHLSIYLSIYPSIYLSISIRIPSALMASLLGLALLEALLIEELAIGASPGEGGGSPLHIGPGDFGLVVVLEEDDVVDRKGDAGSDSD